MSEPTVFREDCLEHAAISDVGMRRSNNQDSFAVELAGDEETWRRRGHVFMVADGMGAHAAGELASKLAVDNVPHLYLKYRDLSAPEALQRAVIETNAKVHGRGQANEDFHNMGTTCSVLALLPQGAVVAHIGDSRVYRLRGQKLEQLTFDHSLLWEMREAGHLAENVDMEALVPKNVITRSLGPNPNVKVDVEGPFPVEVGDTFLLCSDGLTGPVHDEELGPLLANLSPEEACRTLVDLANLRGGPDNITVVIAKVTGEDVTTRVAGTEPIRLGGERSNRNVSPILLGLTGASFLAAIAMALMGEPVAGGVAGAAGLVFVCMILIFLFRELPGGVALAGGRKIGKGPYKTYGGQAAPALVDKLVYVIDQVREKADEDRWDMNWSRVNSCCDQAAAAVKDGNLAAAVREYARGIMFTMAELRALRQRRASDSSVDLA